MGNNLGKKSGGFAFIPLLLFIVIYIVAGVALGDFYAFPSPVALLIAIVVAFIIFKGTINEKMKDFTDGCGDENIQIMLVVYLLAGAFSAVAKAMGGVDATVNFGLTFVPAQFLVAGLFVIASFLGVATGTSMGTITALVPIACGVADKAGLNLPLAIAAVVGGAMFGDNLSMISDTTIAATRTQGVEMKDKFRMNGVIAAPAALITVVLLVVFGRPETAVPLDSFSFEIIKIVPYILVLGLALAGLNVFVTLTVGIASAGIIGIVGGELTVLSFGQSIYNGFVGMNEVFFLSLLVGGLSNMVTKQGGIDWLLVKIKSFIRGEKSAQFGVAALTAAADMATANNTVAIIVCGPITKSISEEYKVDPRKTASILDIVSCIFQGAIPWGAQLLSAGSLAALSGFVISPMEIIPLLWYQWILAAVLIVSFFVPFADGVTKKDPWNWERGKAQSKVNKR
ncbi:MAG: Na+/H+ antiporter NhaC family protein [Oscillospiraceae bacterium]|nr:Na+/H+ antiporter NhaC family protein [Oscillospiraceae bacterium]